MFVEPLHLIDQTIDNLELLDEMFAEEIDSRTRQPARLTLEAKLCLDAKIAIGALLPRLKAARGLQPADASPAPASLCRNCD
jgi:hypothetical protein